MGNVRLFVSHAHKDDKNAGGIVDLIEAALVRDGRILCTSHPNRRDYGYPDSDRIDVSKQLREHLSESSCVVALLTPYSLESRWCLFELGGAWARATTTYSLVAGGVTPAHLPAALKGKLFGKLDDRQDLRRLLFKLSTDLGWQPRNMELAAGDQDDPRVEATQDGQSSRSISLSSASRQRTGLHLGPQIWLPGKVNNGLP